MIFKIYTSNAQNTGRAMQRLLKEQEYNYH